MCGVIVQWCPLQGDTPDLDLEQQQSFGHERHGPGRTGPPMMRDG